MQPPQRRPDRYRLRFRGHYDAPLMPVIGNSEKQEESMPRDMIRVDGWHKPPDLRCCRIAYIGLSSITLVAHPSLGVQAQSSVEAYVTIRKDKRPLSSSDVAPAVAQRGRQVLARRSGRFLMTSQPLPKEERNAGKGGFLLHCGRTVERRRACPVPRHAGVETCRRQAESENGARPPDLNWRPPRIPPS